MNPPPPIQRTPRTALRVELDGRRKPPAWQVEYRLKDLATGRLEHFTPRGGHWLNHASCSPWRDSDERSQLVAQWVSFEGFGDEVLPSGSGIARYSIPDGAVLDQVPIGSPPTSPPCWYPGTEARVLYAAGDGQLYYYNFDEPEEVGGNQPRPLAWPDRPPGLEKVFFSHPTWPTDPRLRGRFIVSLSGLKGSGKGSRFTPSKFWWLQLDPSGSSVESAGRLTVPGADDEGLDERRPEVTTSRDGGLVISYLACPRGSHEGQPRRATIAFDPATHAPIAHMTASDAPVEGGPAIAPRSSADGRQVAHALGGRVR